MMSSQAKRSSLRRSKSLQDSFDEVALMARRRSLERQHSLQETFKDLNTVATTIDFLPQQFVSHFAPEPYVSYISQISPPPPPHLNLKCCICLNPDVDEQVVRCSFQHCICTDCFSEYVHSLCEEPAKLMENSGRVRCPVPKCASDPWSSHDIRSMVNGDVLDNYIDVIIGCMVRLQDFPIRKDSCDESKLVENSLTLLCPNHRCETALDPNPGGCCAMKCLTCGTYFCWLCFHIFENERKCHFHVSKCSENPLKGDLFVRADLIATVHTRRRVEAIRRCLQQTFGSSWHISARAKEVIAACEDHVLKDANISSEDIFCDTSVRPPVSPLSAGGGRRLEDDEQPPRRPMTREEIRIMLTTYTPMAVASWYGGYSIIIEIRQLLGFEDNNSNFYSCFLIKTIVMFVCYHRVFALFPAILGMRITPQMCENVYGSWLLTKRILGYRNVCMEYLFRSVWLSIAYRTLGQDSVDVVSLREGKLAEWETSAQKWRLASIGLLAVCVWLKRQYLLPAEVGIVASFIILALVIDTQFLDFVCVSLGVIRDTCWSHCLYMFDTHAAWLLAYAAWS